MSIRRILGHKCKRYRSIIETSVICCTRRIPSLPSPETVYQMCLHGQLELWEVSNQFAVVQGGLQWQRWVINPAFYAGNLDAAKKFFPEFEEEARRERYERIVIFGRRGWRKALPGFTYTREHVLMKDLT